MQPVGVRVFRQTEYIALFSLLLNGFSARRPPGKHISVTRRAMASDERDGSRRNPAGKMARLQETYRNVCVSLSPVKHYQIEEQGDHPTRLSWHIRCHNNQPSKSDTVDIFYINPETF